MGTNFYFSTRDKEFAHRFTYSIGEEPDLHYEIHLAKTSFGWLPLFQLHSDEIESVEDIKKVYFENKDKLKILDEYGEEYSWDNFEDRVIKFNGGVVGGIEREYIEVDKSDPFYDPDLPGYVPISHFDYGNGKYKSDFVKDDDGYEFTRGEFS